MIVERYLEALTSNDWDTLRATLRDDVVRVGPYNDEYRGSDAYVGFLSSLMPTLPGYSMDVHRVTYADGIAFAELAETVGSLVTEEGIVFELDGEKISRVDVFIKTTAPR